MTVFFIISDHTTTIDTEREIEKGREKDRTEKDPIEKGRRETEKERIEKDQIGKGRGIENGNGRERADEIRKEKEKGKGKGKRHLTETEREAKEVRGGIKFQLTFIIIVHHNWFQFFLF